MSARTVTGATRRESREAPMARRGVTGATRRESREAPAARRGVATLPARVEPARDDPVRGDLGRDGPALWDNSLMTTRRTWWTLGVAALCAALAGFWLARELDSSGPELASGTWLPRPKTVGDFHLTDNVGQPFSLHDLQGKPTLVFFGFTHCPDVCPTTLLKLAKITKAA